jgi:hypothetical protein
LKCAELPDDVKLRSIACAPADRKPPQLLVSGKLMAFLRLVEKPVRRRMYGQSASSHMRC